MKERRTEASKVTLPELIQQELWRKYTLSNDENIKTKKKITEKKLIKTIGKEKVKSKKNSDK